MGITVGYIRDAAMIRRALVLVMPSSASYSTGNSEEPPHRPLLRVRSRHCPEGARKRQRRQMRSALAGRLISGTTRRVPCATLRQTPMVFNKNLLPNVAKPWPFFDDRSKRECQRLGHDGSGKPRNPPAGGRSQPGGGFRPPRCGCVSLLDMVNGPVTGLSRKKSLAHREMAGG
jgi:hypothetical protein